MRKIIGIILLIIIAWGIITSLQKMPFGTSRAKVADHYINKGKEETGAANIVTSVVVSYRSFDTLGEATVLFTAVAGVILVFRRLKK